MRTMPVEVQAIEVLAEDQVLNGDDWILHFKWAPPKEEQDAETAAASAVFATKGMDKAARGTDLSDLRTQPQLGQVHSACLKQPSGW